jgi:hypothetical protein
VRDDQVDLVDGEVGAHAACGLGHPVAGVFVHVLSFHPDRVPMLGERLAVGGMLRAARWDV